MENLQEEKMYHIYYSDSLKKFYDVMLYGDTINTEEEKRDLIESYFAMCLLIPKDKFNKLIKNYGGMKNVINNEYIIELMSEYFAVDEELIKCRIYDNIYNVFYIKINNPNEEIINYSNNNSKMINENEIQKIKKNNP